MQGKWVAAAAAAVMVAGGVAMAQNDQILRGKATFFESPSLGSRCGSCHSLEGKGKPIAPDLRRLAALSPKGMKVAILSTVTEYVTVVELKNGTQFPALKGEETDSTITLWDLRSTPPEARMVNKADVKKFGSNSVWKHPPASANLSAKELADVIAYLRYVAKGETAPVSADQL